MNHELITKPEPDPVAVTVGQLCRKGKTLNLSTIDSLRGGQKLHEKKASLTHGAWLPWQEAHREALGFGARTVQRLIRAYTTWTSVLEEGYVLEARLALEINRFIWGNTTKAQQNKEDRSSKPSAGTATEEVRVPEPIFKVGLITEVPQAIRRQAVRGGGRDSKNYIPGSMSLEQA